MVDRVYKITLEYAKECIMKSNIPIGEADKLMAILNYAEDNECKGTGFFRKDLINKDLRRILNII